MAKKQVGQQEVFNLDDARERSLYLKLLADVEDGKLVLTNLKRDGRKVTVEWVVPEDPRNA